MTAGQLDPAFAATARLQIAAVLAQVDSGEFSRLREITGVSDSVLSKHLSALVEAGYVTLSKSALAGRQRTWASLTKPGRAAFTGHVAALQAMVAAAGAAGAAG
ncbi:transcriptional regulator [Novosphingobium sp.]|uniref:transcriptional regulator n=1 Tax=Novosphingobium sp. TaxID=1874826 RepID=UPI0025DFE16C|nr:transcriptional regulator [Novosphingobium sp.]